MFFVRSLAPSAHTNFLEVFSKAHMPIYYVYVHCAVGGIWKIYRQRLIIEPRSFEILRRLRHDLKYARDA